MGKILLPKGGTQLAVGFKYTLKVEYQLRGPRLLFYPPPYMSMTSLLLYGNCSVDGTAVFPRISVKTEESHILPGFHFMGEIETFWIIFYPERKRGAKKYKYVALCIEDMYRFIDWLK